jgi:putative membrane protein
MNAAASDLSRRHVLFAAMAVGVITPAAAKAHGLSHQGFDPDAGQVRALLATGALALKTSVIALRRSPNPDLREFARSEIAEQRGISRAITGAAEANVPLGRRGAALLAEAQSAPPGLPADRLYIVRQIEGHRLLLAYAQGYAAQGADPEVAGIARRALPLIKLHLSILNGLHGSLHG